MSKGADWQVGVLNALRMTQIEQGGKLSEHSSLLEKLVAGQQKHSDEIAGLRRQVTDLELGMDQRFKKVDQRFDGMDRRFEKIDERFDGMDRRFEKIDERFDGMDRRFEKIDERFEKIDQRLEKHDEMFAVMLTTMHDMQTMLVSHGARLERQGAVLDRHSEILERHSEILERQGRILERHSEILERLDAR
jgi:chromosome segregation ATPase